MFCLGIRKCKMNNGYKNRCKSVLCFYSETPCRVKGDQLSAADRSLCSKGYFMTLSTKSEIWKRIKSWWSFLQ